MYYSLLVYSSGKVLTNKDHFPPNTGLQWPQTQQNSRHLSAVCGRDALGKRHENTAQDMGQRMARPVHPLVQLRNRHEVFSDWKDDMRLLIHSLYISYFFSCFRRFLTFFVKFTPKWFLTCVYNGTHPNIPKQWENWKLGIHLLTKFYWASIMCQVLFRYQGGKDEQASMPLPTLRVWRWVVNPGSAFQT